MDSDSDEESISGEVEVEKSQKQPAHWGKTKYDYYYTDYVDKDYPNKLTAKEERLASIEQEEALRIQKKLLSTIEDANLDAVIDLSGDEEEKSSAGPKGDNLIDFLQQQNQSLGEQTTAQADTTSKKRKRVTFEDEQAEDSDGINEDEDNSEDEDGENDSGQDEKQLHQEKGRERRPINVAMQKNRGLTPYKKKEYRNPRVKHKLKFKKAMSKRRRIVQEAKLEFHRYSGEASGIKTSTIKSIKLC